MSTARPLRDTSMACPHRCPAATDTHATTSQAIGNHHRRPLRTTTNGKQEAHSPRRLLPRRKQLRFVISRCRGQVPPCTRDQRSGRHMRDIACRPQNTRAQQARHGPLGGPASCRLVISSCSVVTWPCAHAQLSLRSGNSSPGFAGPLMRSTGNGPVAGGSSPNAIPHANDDEAQPRSQMSLGIRPCRCELAAALVSGVSSAAEAPRRIHGKKTRSASVSVISPPAHCSAPRRRPCRGRKRPPRPR